MKMEKIRSSLIAVITDTGCPTRVQALVAVRTANVYEQVFCRFYQF
jgi:hypothetical protein